MFRLNAINNNSDYRIKFTICHELRHAYQYQEVEYYENKGTYNEDNSIIKTWKIWVKKKSQLNSPIKVDANAFAKEFIKANP